MSKFVELTLNLLPRIGIVKVENWRGTVLQGVCYYPFDWSHSVFKARIVLALAQERARVADWNPDNFLNGEYLRFEALETKSWKEAFDLAREKAGPDGDLRVDEIPEDGHIREPYFQECEEKDLDVFEVAKRMWARLDAGDGSEVSLGEAVGAVLEAMNPDYVREWPQAAREWALELLRGPDCSNCGRDCGEPREITCEGYFPKVPCHLLAGFVCTRGGCDEVSLADRSSGCAYAR